MSVTYRYMRHKGERAEEMDSVDDALFRAWSDIEYMEAAPVAIEVNGQVLHDDKAISEMVKAGAE